MVLTIAHFLEAFFIALMIVLLTNPHLLVLGTKAQETAGFFHFF